MQEVLVGSEFNIFADREMMQDMRFFTVLAIFVPGTYYHDIKGKPINKDQKEYLNEFNNTGVRVIMCL